MKRNILFSMMVTAWLVGSTAFASIARLAVLGTQPKFMAANQGSVTTNVVNGSLWYDDDYNMFYNPSVILDNKNMVSFNKGLEGGWVSAIGDSFAYGLYINRGGSAAAAYGDTANLVAPGLNSATVTSYGGTSAASGVALDTQRAVDLLFGGDTGIKWGGKLTWAYNRDQTIATAAQEDLEKSARYWHLALGAQIVGFEPFLGATFLTKAQRKTTDTSGSSTDMLDDMNVGVRYKYEAWTPYVTYRQFRRSGNGIGIQDAGTAANADTQVQTSMKVMGLGIGHDTKVADGVHILKNVGIYYNSVEDTAGSTFNLRDYKEYVLPINFALEADVASWLTLRAGAEYDFWYERKLASLTNSSDTPKDKRQSQASTPTVRIGSTFKFGKLHVDSAFGNGNTAANADADDVHSRKAIGFDSNTFAFVSASYRW